MRTEREVQLAYASERLAARPLKFERGKVCTNGVPHRSLGWIQSGSSSMTGVIFFMGILSLRSRPRFRHVLDRATLEGQKQHVHTRFCPSNLVMGRHLLRTVKCRGDGNCGYHSILNEICHLSGQVRTNTVVSASIFCQRYSSCQIAKV